MHYSRGCGARFRRKISGSSQYSMQLSMLKQLRTLKLINENEYRLIEKKLKKDYGVISNITA